MSVGSEGQKYLDRGIGNNFGLSFGKKYYVLRNVFLFLPCRSELTTATDEVEDWDPDRTSQRLLAR